MDEMFNLDKNTRLWWYSCDYPGCKNESQKRRIHASNNGLKGWKTDYDDVHLCPEHQHFNPDNLMDLYE